MLTDSHMPWLNDNHKDEIITTGQLAAQVCEGPGYHSEGRSSVLGVGGDREHTGLAPAHMTATAARGRYRPAGVLREWRVQAAETGGWERMTRKGDSAWFATFRMRVLAALTEGEEGAMYQVTHYVPSRHAVLVHSCARLLRAPGTFLVSLVLHPGL